MRIRAAFLMLMPALEYPRGIADSVLRALKPGGRLALVEYRAEEDRVPVRRLHRMSAARIRPGPEAQGLPWQQTMDTPPWRHIVIFRKP